MAYLEYMLKCAGVPSGDALTELLGTFQNKPASTLEKTASYSEGIRSLGKTLHGTSGGEMYKLGKCVALCKFAGRVSGAFAKQYRNEMKQIYAPQHQAQQNLSAASANVKDLQGQLAGYQDTAKRWKSTVDTYLKDPTMVGNAATAEGKKTLRYAQDQLKASNDAVTTHQGKINAALQARDQAQVAFDNRPRLTADQEARVKELKAKMRGEAQKAELMKLSPSDLSMAEQEGRKRGFWGSIWDAWKESRQRKHELAIMDKNNAAAANEAQRNANEAIANNNVDLGKQQIAADVEMAKSRNSAVGLGLAGAGGLGAVAIASRPTQPQFMYPMPAPVYPQPAPQQQYQQQ